jgi:hypothetical protein
VAGAPPIEGVGATLAIVAVRVVPSLPPSLSVTL